MLLVGEAIKCFTMFSLPPSAPPAWPGKSNEPRFNTRWPPGPWENASDVSSFYLTFTFSTWNYSKCEASTQSNASNIHPFPTFFSYFLCAVFTRYKTYQFSWDPLKLAMDDEQWNFWQRWPSIVWKDKPQVVWIWIQSKDPLCLSILNLFGLKRR